MTRLGNLAKLIRSKNAGPFWIAFDAIIKDEAILQRVVNCRAINKSWIARLWKRKGIKIVLTELLAASAI